MISDKCKLLRKKGRIVRISKFSLTDNINCDFEQMELCDWEQITNDDTDWTLHKSRTPSSHTGPSSDHTTGSKLLQMQYARLAYGKIIFLV